MVAATPSSVTAASTAPAIPSRWAPFAYAPASTITNGTKRFSTEVRVSAIVKIAAELTAAAASGARRRQASGSA